jgi:hypothetical protein
MGGAKLGEMNVIDHDSAVGRPTIPYPSRARVRGAGEGKFPNHMRSQRSCRNRLRDRSSSLLTTLGRHQRADARDLTRFAADGLVSCEEHGDCPGVS